MNQLVTTLNIIGIIVVAAFLGYAVASDRMELSHNLVTDPLYTKLTGIESQYWIERYTNDRLRERIAEQEAFIQHVFPDYNGGELRREEVIATSYNPLKAQTDDDNLISADNKLVEPGIIALPKHYRLELGLKFGQRVVIEGLGVFTVRDHMNSNRPRGRVDIISFIPEWSVEWGRKPATMYWVAE